MHKNPHLKTKTKLANSHIKFDQEKIDNFTCGISWRVGYDNKVLFLENLLTIVERL